VLPRITTFELVEIKRFLGTNFGENTIYSNVADGQPKINMDIRIYGSKISMVTTSLLEEINTMIESMRHYVRYAHNELKTMVYWAIATHAHSELNRFPILRLTSTTHTGKTNATKFVADLCRAAKGSDGNYRDDDIFQQIKGSSCSSIRELINQARIKNHTCCFDEADSFPLVYIESIFDKDGGQTFKLENVGSGQGQGNNWIIDKSIDLYAPVMMNGRKYLEDEPNQNRTIEITGLSDIDWMEEHGQEYRLGTNSEKRDMCAEIASQIDWSEVLDSKGGRAVTVWSPLRAVAQILGDEEFLSYIENQIAIARADFMQGRADETDFRFIEAMIKLCHEEVVNNNQKFPYQLSYEKIADTGGMTTKAVGKMVKQLKLQSKKSGVMYVEGLSARKLSQLCKMVGVREDEWLEGEVK